MTLLYILSNILGGIGLFLLGMILMTDSLKALAGEALRGVLARFTTSRLSAVTTGATITTLVQSSSATTVATIGFVSAGLLSFQNAIGVNIGASLGTTSTGWLVSLLGLKLSIGKLMLPVIGLGALAKILGRGRLAHAGMAVAGFGVIFVGIEVLQGGMQELAGHFQPEDFPRADLRGRLLLVLIGMAMTVVMQSSSAAVATTLAALAGSAISLEQAAALVIGQNIGTTVTAALASIGASAPARRTALMHILFSFFTGTLAFIILPWFLPLAHALGELAPYADQPLSIAAFHTGFNLIGILLFLPLVPRVADTVENLIKSKGPRLTQHLDSSLISVPPVAIEAARRALKEVATELYRFLANRFTSGGATPAATLLEEIKTALAEIRRFLGRIPPPDTQGYEFHRQISTMHALDHLERLTREAIDHGRLGATRQEPNLRRDSSELTALLRLLAMQLANPAEEPDVERAQNFSQRLADERRTARPSILEATAARRIDPERALAELSAQRWIDRLAYHVWRSSHHLREMTREEISEAISRAADSGRSDTPEG